MQATSTADKKLMASLPGIVIIEPKLNADQRGYFFESYQLKRYQALGIDQTFVQDNVSRSCKNTLRGLHYQSKNQQAKLVSVLRGEIFDVAVDIRPHSPTFKQWIAVVLSDQNHKQLYIPAGMAHGFYVLSEVADVHYKCSDYYNSEYETGIIWDDPELAIEWPLQAEPLLSEKDSQLKTLAEQRFEESA